MAAKVNIVLDDDVKKELESLVEAGLRSRVINAALRKELAIIRRRPKAGSGVGATSRSRRGCGSRRFRSSNCSRLLEKVILASKIHFRPMKSWPGSLQQFRSGIFQPWDVIPQNIMTAVLLCFWPTSTFELNRSPPYAGCAALRQGLPR